MAYHALYLRERSWEAEASSMLCAITVVVQMIMIVGKPLEIRAGDGRVFFRTSSRYGMDGDSDALDHSWRADIGW